MLFFLSKFYGRTYFLKKEELSIFPLLRIECPHFPPLCPFFPSGISIIPVLTRCKKPFFLNGDSIYQLIPRVMSEGKGSGEGGYILMTGARHPYGCQLIHSSLRCCKNRMYCPRRTLQCDWPEKSQEIASGTSLKNLNGEKKIYITNK